MARREGGRGIREEGTGKREQGTGKREDDFGELAPPQLSHTPTDA